ncbi:hypothetical protein [Streptomyces sp. NPDC002057]|uniref:hypothetical protein n=1 Tax=Streptomyces sp. NPDC002057 TaxID=3154664 RepID=UPI0033338930
MDNNEVRAGNAAAQAASAISLPTVAWQSAGEEPAGATAAPEPQAGAGSATAPGSGPAPEAEPATTAPTTAAEATPEAAGATASVTEPDTARTPAGTAAPGGPDSSVVTAPDGEAETAGETAPDSGREGEQQAAPDAESLAAAAAPAATPRSVSRPAKRLSKPMIAAAATSGVVLMGVPLLFSQLGGGSGPGPVPPRPTGYNQADGGSDGFVPGVDTPEKGSSLPGAAAPGAATGGHGGGPEPANNPLAKSAAGLGAGAGVGSVGLGPSATQSPGTGGGSGDSRPSAGQTPGTGRTSAPGGSRPTSGPTTGARPSPTPTRSRETVSTPQKTPAPPAKAQYSAVAGPACAGSGASFSYNGWYTDGKEGWQRYGSGGYVGSGCNGGFFSLPMSGSASKDAGHSLRWTFRTGAVTSGTCQVSVHIPNNSDIKAVGGKPSYYTVHAGATGNDPILRSFTVNQASSRGLWISAGGVSVTRGLLTVKLHDRGVDWSGSKRTYAHHAGDAARVQCTSS